MRRGTWRIPVRPYETRDFSIHDDHPTYLSYIFRIMIWRLRHNHGPWKKFR